MSASAPARPPLKGLSSMATRALLADLAAQWQARGGRPVAIESVGGVDAAKRVAAGEVFDLVMLASDALDRLIADGHLAAPRTDLVRSPVAVAVAAGAPAPDIGTEAALREAVVAAPSIGFSTGPSGTHLQRLFARWGLAEELAARTVQAPPGVPVGRLVAEGRCALGFQQLSELQGLAGVQVLGTLPEGAAFITTFSAARPLHLDPAHGAENEADVLALLAFLTGPEAEATVRRHGMTPAR